MIDFETYTVVEDDDAPTNGWTPSDHWTPFEALGNGISVSYCKTADSTWTWKFRNEGASTITVMTFRFQDDGGWHDAILPLSLRPGGVCGGAASFVADRRPTIGIKDVKRRLWM